jgi:hypothetical protein
LQGIVGDGNGRSQAWRTNQRATAPCGESTGGGAVGIATGMRRSRRPVNFGTSLQLRPRFAPW